MKQSLVKFAFRAIFFLFFVSVAFSESGDIKQNVPVSSLPYKWSPVFPSALWVKESQSENEIMVYTVKTKEEMEASLKFDESKLQSVLLNNDIFALYGKPGAYTMGILGRYSPEQIEPIMNEFAANYDEVNNERGIIPAFYLIYGTCWPGGDIGLLRSSTVKKYIEFAAERGWYVFIDHQIGKYTVEQAMNAILPFLKYPNVHLALDPEWRTTQPMKVIGSVTGDEINKAQEIMDKYIKENNITGRRMLVIHQFNSIMIKQRANVRSDYERVQLIHCADGFGPPRLKRDSYAYNALAKNIPLKSFKLFSKPTVAGAGYDQPMMSPKEVFGLNPRPYLIMYQ
ncbi:MULTISPECIES: hypothetical protein [unclassified Treponema]|uniref:hypothetical protein n=1 Tax=unclassified Treponema TaxID=2638727 RepID=UPI0020A3B58C|nr:MULTISPECIES: hypothetical protein [unclassified Treponema]UTC66751.1 hypothetical protein E4O06_12460 [Treponema sp. OMZ 789]UTC69483.1 hypothetical protein E4O01_12600 [Treponema sp. OMZ 790]UTC72197.1 hypothetical protein E4O02_12695 [Treponema sp. OMZ 791]